MEDIDLLNSVADNIQGRTICALGDAAAMPVRAMIKHFRDEFVALIEKTPRRCTPARSARRQHPSEQLRRGVARCSTAWRAAPPRRSQADLKP